MSAVLNDALLLVASLIAAVHFGFFIALYINPASAVSAPAVAFTALALSSLIWIAWELAFGSAFRYCFPKHGTRPLSALAWRTGVFVKSLLFAALLAALAQVARGESDAPLTIHKLRVFTPLSALEGVVVALAPAPVVGVTLLCALVTMVERRTASGASARKAS